jgi:hypothetical protein
MIRDQYKTVTSKGSFAILIPASRKEAIGEATFQIEVGKIQPVRAVTLQDLKKTAKGLKGAEGARFDALLALKGALEAGDKLALAKAKERLERAYQMRESESPLHVSSDPELDQEFAEAAAWSVGLSPEESVKHIEGLRPGPRARQNPSRLLSYEVSQSVDFPNAQIVLWLVNETFRPAIYCSDTKTALYIHTFFIAPGCGLGFRICPQCTEQFFQDRPNQDYCCPAHREAHRVARWREQKKGLTAQKG